MSSTLQFGQFVVESARRCVLKSGVPLPIGPRAYDVLAALLERHDRVVSKSELMDIVWPDVFVEENNLQVQICTLRKFLGTATISTVPARGYRFTAALDQQPVPAGVGPPSGSSLATSSLPPLPPTGIVGREDDLRLLERRMRQHPLLTLVGAGGVGKTSLALRAAHGLVQERAMPALWLTLAPLGDAASIDAALRRACGLPAVSHRSDDLALETVLADSPCLLVLDNAEHVVEPVVRLLQRLRSRCPGLRILATSQIPLRIAGEQVFRLRALTIPADKQLGVDAAHLYGAVALFHERAEAADARFELTQQNLPVVIDICRRLDGLPLALELAAARLPLVGLVGLSEGLHQQLRLLGGGRPEAPWRLQSLQAALEWTCALLTPVERRALHRLCVFAGGFTLELAQAVLIDEETSTLAAIDLLAALVDRSLVDLQSSQVPRYRLLEAPRQFALEQMDRLGEGRDARARHLAAMIGLATERANNPPRSYDSFHAGHDPEIDNLSAALAWGTQHDRPRALDLVGRCEGTFRLLGRRDEYVRWSDALASTADEYPDDVRYWNARAAAFYLHSVEESARCLDRMAAIYRRQGRRDGLIHLLFSLVGFAYGPAKQAALDEAEALLIDGGTVEQQILLWGARASIAPNERAREGAVCMKEAIRLAKSIGNSGWAAALLAQLCSLLDEGGFHEEACLAGREGLSMCRSQIGEGDAGGVIHNIQMLNFAEANAGHRVEARALAEEAVSILHTCHGNGTVFTVQSLVRLALMEERWDDAARLLGYTDLLFDAYIDRTENPLPGTERSRVELLARMGAEVLARRMAEGRRFTPLQACDVGVRKPPPPVSETSR